MTCVGTVAGSVFDTDETFKCGNWKSGFEYTSGGTYIGESATAAENEIS